uniref:BURP domain-containing protein n=2 Tax=Oryza brachyantha TaxID=4533 RepID=J3MDH8_ORYBR
MFAPASDAIADEMRWVLEKCDSPWQLTGERRKAGCATSMEDLVELPMSLLGTRRLHALSTAGMLPVEAASGKMVTCHDMTYPYAVFYCHMAGPATRAYSVALASRDAGAELTAMEVLAVCHLNTSRWSSKHPFLLAMRAKPGDVAPCHFLPKSSVIWVPIVEQGDGRAAVQ